MKNQHGGASVLLLIIMFSVVFSLTIGGLMAEFTLEKWLSLFKGTPVDVPFFGAVIVAFFTSSNILVPVWVITFVCFMAGIFG